MNVYVRALWNRLLGDRGERAAARFLRRRGCRVVTRGYRTARGEIDLIVRDGDVLVFVEVKTRRAGVPVEAVTLEKRRRLTRAALEFVRRFHLSGVRARFDVVAIVWPDAGREPTIEHYVNAFEPPDLDPFSP
ncbi:MAG: YraN family protein [Isosphaeraceae bacterium]